MFLGKMEVTRAKPELGKQVGYQCIKQLGRVFLAAAAANFRGILEARLTQWTTSSRPGLHRALGDGDDVQMRQKDGSVTAIFERKQMMGRRL